MLIIYHFYISLSIRVNALIFKYNNVFSYFLTKGMHKPDGDRAIMYDRIRCNDFSMLDCETHRSNRYVSRA